MYSAVATFNTLTGRVETCGPRRSSISSRPCAESNHLYDTGTSSSVSSPTQSLSVTHTAYRVRSHLRDSPHQISDVTQPPTHPYTRPSAGVGLGTHSNASSVTRLGKLIAWIEAAQHSVHSAHCPPSAYNPLPFSVSNVQLPIPIQVELFHHSTVVRVVQLCGRAPAR
jgi:hypothetical protein